MRDEGERGEKRNKMAMPDSARQQGKADGHVSWLQAPLFFVGVETEDERRTVAGGGCLGDGF